MFLPESPHSTSSAIQFEVDVADIYLELNRFSDALFNSPIFEKPLLQIFLYC
jgi:hypothetical protein